MTQQLAEPDGGLTREDRVSLLEFVRRANSQVKIEKAPGGDYGFAFDSSKPKKLTGWEPQILIRDKIPVIAENIRKGISVPPS